MARRDVESNRDLAADFTLCVAIVLGMLSFRALRLDGLALSSALADAMATRQIDPLTVVANLLAPLVPGLFLVTRRLGSIRNALPPWPLLVYILWALATLPFVRLPVGLAVIYQLSMVGFSSWYVRMFGVTRLLSVVSIPVALTLALGIPYEVLGLDPRESEVGWFQRFDGFVLFYPVVGYFAGVLAIVAGCYLAQRLSSRGNRSNRVDLWFALGALGFVLGLVCVVWAQSRTPLLAFALAAPAIVFRRRYFAVAFTLGVVGTLAIAAGLTPEAVFSPLARPAEVAETGPLTGRADIWELARSEIMDSAVVGNGTAVFLLERSAEVGVFDRDGIAKCPCLPKNSWLSVGTNHGVPGVALAVVIIGLAGLRSVGRPGPSGPILLFLVLAAGTDGVTLGLEPTFYGLAFYPVLIDSLIGDCRSVRAVPEMRDIRHEQAQAVPQEPDPV